MKKILVLIALVLTFLGGCSTSEVQNVKKIQLPEVKGVGARPVNEDIASTWFTESIGQKGGYKIHLIVFMMGEKGLTKKKTKWSIQMSELSFSKFIIDEHIKIEIIFSANKRKAYIGEIEIDTTKNNVVVLGGLGKQKLELVYMEKQKLVFPLKSNVHIETIRRSIELQKILKLI